MKENRTLTLDQEFFKKRRIKTEFIRKLSNFHFKQTKKLTPEYFKPYLMIAFFFTLFEGYKCNRMYERTPKETKVLMGPEKTNFSDHELQLTN